MLDAVQRSAVKPGRDGILGGGIVATSKHQRTTAADIAAAVKMGTMAADAVVVTAADAAAMAAESAPTGQPVTADVLSGSEHQCGIPGCRHGAAHPAQSQPDRQVKLQCPGCGAVARMTSSAIGKALGITCHRDGQSFAPAARRTYNRKSA